MYHCRIYTWGTRKYILLWGILELLLGFITIIEEISGITTVTVAGEQKGAEGREGLPPDGASRDRGAHGHQHKSNVVVP